MRGQSTLGGRPERLRTRLPRNVQVPVADTLLEGRMTIPPGARALVVFAQGGGGGRSSPHNQYLADELQAEGLATLLFDLLGPEEEVVDAFATHVRYDIDALTARLVAVTDWVRHQPETRTLAIGYFAASTGVVAAFAAAAARPVVIHAIVARSGRVDLAEAALERVVAPTLLVVGSEEVEVLALARTAFERFRCEKVLEVVRGASSLFKEPNALETAARLAVTWFTRHLGRQERTPHAQA